MSVFGVKVMRYPVNHSLNGLSSLSAVGRKDIEELDSTVYQQYLMPWIEHFTEQQLINILLRHHSPRLDVS